MSVSSQVTVLLPVYNGEGFLQAALDSVLLQRGVDFELLVIDDGSTDNSSNIIAKVRSPRVRLFAQPNRGLAQALNRGVELASSEYIARQDADDLMLPDRLVKQLAFLETNADCAMVGTWCEIWVGEQPTGRRHQHPTSHEALRLELLFDNPFVHSSVMIRTRVLRELGGYCEDNSRQPPEDYELWSRIARQHRVANIPEVLTIYREIEGSMSRANADRILDRLTVISAENLLAVLAPDYSLGECFDLACLYHLGPTKQPRRRLSRKVALNMLDLAAFRIGGKLTEWSEEFSASYKRQQRRILSQTMIRQYVPRLLRDPARRFKRLVSGYLSGMIKIR